MSTDTARSTITLVTKLAESVQSFHERFGLVGTLDPVELASRVPIQAEEVRELQQAILNEPPDRVAEEAADVLFVAIGTMLRLEPEHAVNALQQVIAKNDAKTHETHHFNSAGKIVRRSTTGPASAEVASGGDTGV